ncbi:MAG: peptide ABC transporter substrate-binding protein [Candidatus Moranbacteria bacterium]|nr:peptide ABC transporter substrate-binding protein [Candidatus Moranbacteria bacterium]
MKKSSYTEATKSSLKSSSKKIKSWVKIFNKKEKTVLYCAIFLFVFALAGWSVYYYFSSTKEVAAQGGEYTEGIVGKPIYVNPLLSQTNEIDVALSDLIYSSLFKYGKNAEIKNDLAESYQVSENKKTYTIKIKEDVKWHDGKPLTAEDIYFTVRLIQNPQFKSTLRSSFQDVEVEAVDERTVKFKLQEPFSPFLNKLTFGILPKHIFKNISSGNFLINEFNLKPVGSGPFEFSNFEKDEQDNIISYQLIANDEYYGQRPYLEQLNFSFYTSEKELIDAYNKKEINGFGIFSYDNIKQFEDDKTTRVKSFEIPRYFSVFYNQTKSKALSDKNVRRALSYAINREQIINEVFHGYAREVYSPVLDSFGKFSSNDEAEKYFYSTEEAKKILEEAGWEEQDNGIRVKTNDDEKIELKIALVCANWSPLEKSAEKIKKQWEEVGAEVEVKTLEINEVQQNYIKTRDYEALLFGQEYFGNDPDPYHFWHSSEKQDPGKNLAVFDEEEADKLLEEAREIHDVNKREEKYNQLEKIITEESPASFLFSADYVYIVNDKVKGLGTQSVTNPALRFQQINDWYINTKRVKKD